MSILKQTTRTVTAALALAVLGGCAQTGSLGGVLGSVLGQQTPTQGNVSATVRSVDTRAQQIIMTQANGQQIAVSYDNQTQVVYQNRNYSVTSLEYGDQVTAQIQTTANGGYSTSGTVQSLQGTVRQVNVSEGWFTMDTGNGTLLTVSMPYNPASSDVRTFQSLRNGDFVRITGVFLNNTRVELRQFY